MMESSLKSPALTMRILKYAFVVSGLLFVYIGFKVLPQPTDQASHAIQAAITFVGLVCVIGGFSLPGLLFRGVESRSQNATAEVRLQLWMKKSIVSLAFFEASILFGLELHLLGGRTALAGLLMGAGIAAELIWSPGAPPGPEGGEFPQG